LNGTCHLVDYASDVNILGRNINITNKNTEALSEASKEVGLEVNNKKRNTRLCLITKTWAK